MVLRKSNKMPSADFTLLNRHCTNPFRANTMILEDFRALLMLDWLQNDLLLEIGNCEPASSDASFRRYFRVETPEQTFIVMDAPPDKENLAAFIQVAALLKHAQIRVPAIYQQNLTEGFLLLEDFGHHCFLDLLNDENVDGLYQQAMDSLFLLQSHTPPENCGLPVYDQTFLERELAIFAEWFLQQLLGIDISVAVWQKTCDKLINSALQQPQVLMHRDYHSRNLMVAGGALPGVIDFQDAVIGPVTYDLVSLLRDCYICWPEPRVQAWRHSYHQRLLAANIVDVDMKIFAHWFDLMGLQRHLKAIGIFSRLHLRDGKSTYLMDIPRTLSYVSHITASYVELAEFNDLLNSEILPAVSQHLLVGDVP